MRKTRHILAERLIAPKKCCDGQNERALAFKKIIIESSLTERLNADFAAKAAMSLGTSIGASSSSAKQTYEDTDNKKRDFGGDLPPGLTSENGYIFEPSRDGTDTSYSLKLLSSKHSRDTIKTTPNFGWVKREVNETQQKPENKPQIVLKKYKVNPKTDDIIQSSEEVINPFSKFSGKPFSSENIPVPESLNSKSDIKTKILPGRPLSSRVPGGGLLSRAAAAIGIIRDANNKFRCPPGTPAANQFTDMYGTTCFGFSPTKFGKFVHEKAMELTDAGQMQGFKRTVNRARNWLATGGWDDDQGRGDMPINRLIPSYKHGSSAVGWDPVSGKSIMPDWEHADVPADMRVFRNGAVNAQRRMKAANKTVDDLARALGVDTSSTARATNQDLMQVFEALRSRGDWNLQIQRPSEKQIEAFINARVEAIARSHEFSLTPRDLENLARADLERYYSTERAIMTAQLEQFTRMPETMKNLKILQLHTSFSPGASKANDEGGFFFHNSTGKELLPAIEFKIDKMMENQEAGLPRMRPNERLMISAVGGSSDTERMSAVADFMARADEQAKNVAGLSGGTEGWSRHVALHEIGHLMQGLAYVKHVNDEIERTGSFKYIDKSGRTIEVDDLRKLKGSQVMDIMLRLGDGADLGDPETLNKLNNVYGSYPNMYGGGRMHLEAQAELWALREAGFIDGEDIDAALDYMDSFRGGITAETRSRKSKEYIKKMEAGEPTPSRGLLDIYDVDRVETSFEERLKTRPSERSIEDRRRLLNGISKKARSEDVDEDELIDEAAKLTYESEVAGKQIQDQQKKLSELEDSLKTITKKSDRKSVMDQISVLREQIEMNRQDKEFADEAYKRIRNGWRSRFGIGAPGESSNFDDKVFELRKELGKLTPEEKESLVKRERINKLISDAKELKESELIDEITAIQIRFAKDKFDSPEERLSTFEKQEILVNEYINRAIAGGDTRKRHQIRKEIISKIEEKVSPKPKPTKKFKSAAETKDYASKERKKLRKKITKKQADAIREIADFESKDVVQMLKPEKNASAGRAMNRANARLKRLGLEPDSSSSSDGSMVEQIENILIPTLDAMEVSSASEPFEMEAIIEFAPGELSGSALGKEINNVSFVDGIVIGKGHKKSDVSKKADPLTGKKQRRVIVSIKEGDRGIFPTAKSDEKQKFVVPPGKMKVVGRDKDGTIRVEISSQKGTTEVLDDLARDIEDGSGDAIWRKSAARKVKEISDKRVIEKPERLSSGRKNDSEERSTPSSQVMEKLSSSGATFGDYSKERDDEIDSDRTGSLSDWLNDPKTELEMLEREESGPFRPGPITMTREERQRRIKKLRRQLEREGRESSGMQRERTTREAIRAIKEPDTTKASSNFDPREVSEEVQQIIDSSKKEQLDRRIDLAAVEFHSGIDKRPRVRMRESELDEFASSGKVRATKRSGSAVVSGQSRRAERLSSGQAPLSRKDKEKAAAKKARDKVEKTIENIPLYKREDGISDAENDARIARHLDNYFSELTDDDLLSMGIERVFNPDGTRRKSFTSGQEILRARDPETALKLLALNQTVLMDDNLSEAESRMVSEAGKQLSKLLDDTKQLRDNASIIRTINLCKLYIGGVNHFCEDNLQVDRLEMPQVGGRARDPKSLALRMWKSKMMTAELVESHKAHDKNIVITRTQKQITELRNAGNDAEADALQRKLSIVQALCDGFSGATQDQINGTEAIKIEIKTPSSKIDEATGKTLNFTKEEFIDITPEEAKKTLLEFDISITGKEVKRLGEIRNRNALDSSKPALTDAEETLLMDHLDFSMVEPDGVDLFLGFLKRTNGTTFGEEQTVDPKTLKASQRELDGGKVDGISENIIREVKALKKLTGDARKKEIDRLRQEHGLFKKIIVSEDGYIVDGHHRIFGKIVANPVVGEDLGVTEDDLDLLGVQVIKVNTPIVELLTQSRVFQDVLGIKPASLTKGEDKYDVTLPDGRHIKEASDMIPDITKQEVDDLLAEASAGFGDKVEEIYDKGTFIQVDAVGYKSPERKKYLRIQLDKQEEARASRRRKGIQTADSRLSSGAVLSQEDEDLLNEMRTKPSGSSSDGRVVWKTSKLKKDDRTPEQLKEDRERQIQFQKYVEFLDEADRLNDAQRDRKNDRLSSGALATAWMVSQKGGPQREHSLDAARAKEAIRSSTYSLSKSYRREIYTLNKEIADLEKTNPGSEYLQTLKDKLSHTENLLDSMENRLSTLDDIGKPKIRKGNSARKSAAKTIKKLTDKNSRDKYPMFKAVELIANFEETNELDYSQATETIKRISELGGRDSARAFVNNLFSRKAIDQKQKTALERSVISEIPDDLDESIVEQHNKFKNIFDSVMSKVDDKLPASTESRQRTKIRKRGFVDKLIEREEIGREAKKISLSTESLGKPKKISAKEYDEKVGEVPGMKPGATLISAETLTSSRVKNMTMYRGRFKSDNGETNKVFGFYEAPNGTKYTIAPDEDGIEGRYYAYVGNSRLSENQSIGKVVLETNYGNPRKHDIFFAGIDEEHRDTGLAQAIVEVAKADFPDGSFTIKRVTTEDGANFARGLASERLSSGANKNKNINANDVVSKLNKTIKDTNIDKESHEKIMFALTKIPEYEKGSTSEELNNFVEKIKFISGNTIANSTIDYMMNLGLITEFEKENIDIDLEQNDFDGMAQKANAVKNAFIDGSNALSDMWSPENNDFGTGRTMGSKYAGRKFGPDEFDFEESDLNANSSFTKLRRDYWNSIGLNDEISDEMLPVSGYVVHKSHIENKKKKARALGNANIDDDSIFEIGDSDIIGDGLTAQGEIEVVLRSDVANRTAYAKGNSLKTNNKPVLMNSASPKDIRQALTTNKNGEDTESIINMLGYSIDKDGSSINSKKPVGSKFKKPNSDLPDDFEHEPLQAHILGGFDKDEVDSINYPFSKVQKMADKEKIDDIVNDNSIAETLRKAGFTEAEINYFYQISSGKALNTQSMQALRSYRAAQRIRNKYKKQGFEKVNFAHPNGFNIDNPKTYNINAKPNQSVEDLLKDNINKEITEEAKRVLREIRSANHLKNVFEISNKES